jgi:hypothetical protein
MTDYEKLPSDYYAPIFVGSDFYCFALPEPLLDGSLQIAPKVCRIILHIVVAYQYAQSHNNEIQNHRDELNEARYTFIFQPLFQIQIQI